MAIGVRPATAPVAFPPTAPACGTGAIVVGCLISTIYKTQSFDHQIVSRRPASLRGGTTCEGTRPQLQTS